MEPLPQLTEHDGPLQVTWQVAPFEQETLPLVPTARVQVEWSQLMLALSPMDKEQVLEFLQSTLHEAPQAPEQVFWFTQASDVELPPSTGVHEQLAAV